jgi:hypothetical protein
MLVAIIAAPGLLGSQEAIRQSQSKEKREEHRARRCNLIATCVKSSIRSREINGRPVVLRNGKLWIDIGTEDGAPFGHPYAGYYLPYPDSTHEGLVTTITDIAPIMNWVYVDKETHEVKYGVRVDAQPNLTGPFDCTRQDRRMTFDGWEGFCAVEELPGLWALYFDVDDNGLEPKVPPGTRVLEIELSRKEKRFQKEPGVRQHDQTTKRAVDAQEDAPVDQPLAPEALVSKPGVIDEMPQVQEESVKPKPFRIPKSIFENPPPALESSIFERPLTPPPAYSTTAETAPPKAGPTTNTTGSSDVRPLTTNQSDNTKKCSAAPSSSVDRSVITEGSSTITTSSVARSASTASPPQVALSLPSNTPPSRSISPADAEMTTISGKRTTPKLNRSSGTRALAQAQMFEAMATGQKPKSNIHDENNRRTSRASSNADSTSQYSRDSQDMGEEVRAAPSVPQMISPTPAPLALATSMTKEARKLAERGTSSSIAVPKQSAQRPRTPPRQRALTEPSDPAVFGAGKTTRTSTRAPSPRQNRTNILPLARSAIPRSSSQASNQSAKHAFQRRDTSTDQAGTPRPLIQRRDTAASAKPPTQRRDTANSRRTAMQRPNAASSPAQANIAGTRSSLASTMTSGKGNRAMMTRVDGASGRGRAATVQSSGPDTRGRKTTSALFREIDDLVNQDV